MSADTYKAKLAIEALKKYLAECKSGDFATGDHPIAPTEAVIDLIETYEWLLERRDHLALDHEALKSEHERTTSVEAIEERLGQRYREAMNGMTEQQRNAYQSIFAKPSTPVLGDGTP